MSIWDVIKGSVKSTIGIAKMPYDLLRGDKDAKKLMNQQMKDYQEQSRITKEELARAKDTEAVEKRRIQEKQIRALRGKGSSRGFLGSTSSEATTPGMTSSLGG